LLAAALSVLAEHYGFRDIGVPRYLFAISVSVWYAGSGPAALAVILLILADYTLPSFDGLAALKLAMSMRPEIPFIFVSGTLGEEVAIEAVKIGATDYILKTRLSRLLPSVRRALREAADRAERKLAHEKLRRSEAYLAQAQKLSQTGSFGWDLSTGGIYWSEETFRIFQFEPTPTVTVDMVLERTHPEDRAAVRELIDRFPAREKSGILNTAY
jgi:CheY-like chemotaxis protein